MLCGPGASRVRLQGMSSGPLRVLYVMHTAAPDGSSASLQHLIAHLPRDQVEPFVVSPAGPVAETLRRSGVTVLPIGGVSMLHSIAGMPLRGLRLVELGRTVLNLRHGPRLRDAIEAIRPDIVHLNERGMLQAAVMARRSGAAVVMHARSVADPRPAWVVRLSRRIIARNVDRVIAIDGSVRRSLGALAATDVVHNPLAARPTEPPEPAASSAPPAPTPTGDRVRVVYLTGLAPAKGIWDLVAAAERLGGRTDIEFVIAGANGRSPAFHRSLSGRLAQLTGLVPDVESDLRRRVSEGGLDGTITLVGHLEDPGPLIRSSDILVFPSHHDGPGRSVIEAAIEGVPSIVALRHRVEDVVVDGESGLIVPPRDPAALVAAIERLADDPALRSRLGAAAQAGAATRSDPTVVARQVVEIYWDVMISRGTGSGHRPTPSSGSRSRP
jgi:glycosyltransferase involved in cell wall biosynthesis